MRVLLVLGYSFPTQQALWEEASRRAVDLHVAYTLDLPRGGDSGPPAFGTPHELAGVGLRGDRLTWMAYPRLRPLVERVQPHLVHVINEPWSLIALQATRSRACPVVTHGAENLWDQGGRLEVVARRRATQRILRRTSGFVSWNREGVAWARRRGLRPASPTLVLAAELPYSERFSHREGRRASGRGAWGVDQELVIGYVGQLTPEKGIGWLLGAWARAELPDHCRLVFIGDGPMAATISAAGVDDPRIRLVGPVPLREVPTVMASLDALVVPSLTTSTWCEQYGRVITEAMASGVPVIASDSGAIPEVVGDAGLLVDEGSTADLAAALVRLASDPRERDRLGRAGSARAATEFSPGLGADRLVSFWHDVLATPQRRPAESGPGT